MVKVHYSDTHMYLVQLHPHLRMPRGEDELTGWSSLFLHPTGVPEKVPAEIDIGLGLSPQLFLLRARRGNLGRSI
jgi:hypothetical protein